MLNLHWHLYQNLSLGSKMHDTKEKEKNKLNTLSSITTNTLTLMQHQASAKIASDLKLCLISVYLKWEETT